VPTGPAKRAAGAVESFRRALRFRVRAVIAPTPSEAAIAAERTAAFLASSIASLLASAGEPSHCELMAGSGPLNGLGVGNEE
jgi:hypothetical protein